MLWWLGAILALASSAGAQVSMAHCGTPWLLSAMAASLRLVHINVVRADKCYLRCRCHVPARVAVAQSYKSMSVALKSTACSTAGRTQPLLVDFQARIAPRLVIHTRSTNGPGPHPGSAKATTSRPARYRPSGAHPARSPRPAAPVPPAPPSAPRPLIARLGHRPIKPLQHTRLTPIHPRTRPSSGALLRVASPPTPRRLLHGFVRHIPVRWGPSPKGPSRGAAARVGGAGSPRPPAGAGAPGRQRPRRPGGAGSPGVRRGWEGAGGGGGRGGGGGNGGAAWEGVAESLVRLRAGLRNGRSGRGRGGARGPGPGGIPASTGSVGGSCKYGFYVLGISPGSPSGLWGPAGGLNVLSSY